MEEEKSFAVSMKIDFFFGVLMSLEVGVIEWFSDSSFLNIDLKLQHLVGQRQIDVNFMTC